MMASISSFVGISEDNCDYKYNFILEIAYTGLGLGYDRVQDTARDPLTGEELTGKAIFQSRVYRAMIDVALKLRRNKEYKDLLFSSCTRLADLSRSGENYQSGYNDGNLKLWPENVDGIHRKLKAIHGGLYPQSHLVVADDPAAEIAARVWIDKKGKLEREDLMDRPLLYHEWLESGLGYDHAKIVLDLKSNFKVNTIEGPQTGNNEDGRDTEPDDEREDIIFSTPGDIKDAFKRLAERSEQAVDVWIAGLVHVFFKLSGAEEKLNNVAVYHNALSGRFKELDYWLEHENNIDINASSGLHGTPLSAACVGGHWNAVDVLIRHGADVNRGTPDFDRRPLNAACEKGDNEIVELLVREGAVVDHVPGVGRTALEAASEMGRIDIVRTSLQQLDKEAEENATKGLSNWAPSWVSRLFSRPKEDSGDGTSIGRQQQLVRALTAAHNHAQHEIVALLQEEGVELATQPQAPPFRPHLPRKEYGNLPTPPAQIGTCSCLIDELERKLYRIRLGRG
ncbi:hypothetical protein PG985_015745 [Apiospora marii]|uniref:Uncharacterized protein n=1 Tax=Apiospora marii TaxID=335849 RepID=A0ABR1S4P7_9PEZI